jgi:hypothetical protein
LVLLALLDELPGDESADYLLDEVVWELLGFYYLHKAFSLLGYFLHISGF